MAIREAGMLTVKEKDGLMQPHHYVVEIEPDHVIWRDMNIAVRKDASNETRQFAK